MSLHDRFNFDNDYRNAAFQQTGTITMPGAVMALQDLTGTLADAMQRGVDADSAVERAKSVKVYMARGREIREKVRKYPPRGSVREDLAHVCDSIEASYLALVAVYNTTRAAAQSELLREAGL